MKTLEDQEIDCRKKQSPKKQSEKHKEDSSGVSGLIDEESSSKKENNTQNRIDCFFGLIAKWLPIAVGVAIALFTWKIMHTSEQSMKIANRAYMSLKKPTLKNINDVTNFEFELVFENTGQTPAFNTRSISDMELRSSPPDNIILEPARSDTVPKRTVVGKNSSIFVNVEFKERPTSAEIEKINKGELLINCFGILKYDDIFEEPHRIRYCFYFNAMTKALTYCPKHNDAN